MGKKEVAFKVVVDTSEVNDSLERSIDTVEELGTATKKTSNEMKSGFKAAEQGTKKLGSSIGSLIKSLGLIGVAMAVFEFMRDIVSKNQKIMDALSTATTAFEIVLYKVFDALEPISDAMKAAFENPKQAVVNLWEAIKENLVNRLEGVVLQFEALGSVIKAALDLDWDGITEGAKDFASATVQVATGLDKVQQAAAVESFKNFVSEVQSGTKAAVDQAAELVKLRNEVKLLNVEQKRLQLIYQQEAEVQRQIRDDISLTVAERLAANEELGRILDKQIAAEQKAVDKRIELAEKELALNRDSVDLQVALKEAKLEQAELDERITSQRSEQLTNQKALEKELFDFQQELRTGVLEGREKELEETELYYNNLNEIARKAGEDNFEIEAARAKAINELNERYRQEDVENAKKAAKEKADNESKIAAARLTAASSVGDTLGALGDLMIQQGQENTVAAKTMAIAQIAIDTAAAISGAIKTATQGSATPWDMIAGIGAGVAAVISAVAQATSIINGVNIGGGTATTPSASSVTSSAPSFVPVTTNTTELGNTQQAELAPIQAFVVETQLTNTQSEIGQIQSQATFGGG